MHQKDFPLRSRYSCKSKLSHYEVVQLPSDTYINCIKKISLCKTNQATYVLQVHNGVYTQVSRLVTIANICQAIFSKTVLFDRPCLLTYMVYVWKNVRRYCGVPKVCHILWIARITRTVGFIIVSRSHNTHLNGLFKSLSATYNVAEVLCMHWSGCEVFLMDSVRATYMYTISYKSTISLVFLNSISKMSYFVQKQRYNVALK